MSRWFRFYDDSVNDPKVQRLDGDTFKVWVNLLCIASKNDGFLPDLADIAFILRMDESAVLEILGRFSDLNLLDGVDGKLCPHNWASRQYKSDVTDPTNNERQARYRERKRNGSNAVTVTATRTDTESEQNRTESEQIHAKFLEIAKTDSDDPTLYGSLYGIQQLLSAGYSSETILAGAASAMRGKEKPPNWAYFSKVIQSENERRAAPAKPERGAFVPTKPVDPDEKAIAFFKKVGRWHHAYGPEPGSPGCRASPDLLAKYGYATEAA